MISLFGLIFTIMGCIIGVISYYLSIKKLKENLKNKQKQNFIVHNVIVDGIKGAGKTTFIARLINPTMTKSQLEDISPTINSYTREMPICFERNPKEDNSSLHMLKFHDISGQKASTFIDALDDIFVSDKESQSTILLIIWDISGEKKEENNENLIKERIEMAYGNKKARTIIKSVVVFFNKTDANLNRESMERIIEIETEKINKLFECLFEKGYGDIKFYAGSALEGSNVLSCYGEIVKKFQLEHYFQSIKGN